MANIYNSQLDAFDLYHKIREIVTEEHERSRRSAGLPALGHAVAGSTASALSNVVTYPLDLIITRLQTQKLLRKDHSTPQDGEYKDVWDAISKIYNQEGGLAGFYTGVLPDTGKTVLDSFLFFLLYNFLRQKRLAKFAKNNGGKQPSLLPAADELGIGFIAGSLTKLVTTPISNIVTRMQTNAMSSSNTVGSEMAAGADKKKQSKDATQRVSAGPSSRQIIQDIHTEKGLPGFWSGYSASLVLTLNPSLTFFLFEAIKRILLPREKRNDPPASATFFIAAISKALASSVTYPFSLAKARMQAKGSDGRQSSTTSQQGRRTTIFHTLLYIASTDGLSSLYEGLPLEITKGFFSHGITMLLKQSIHHSVLSLYLWLSRVSSSLQDSITGSKRRSKKLLLRLRDQGKDKGKDYYDMAIDRAGELAETVSGETGSLVNGAKVSLTTTTESLVRTSDNLVKGVVGVANETAELVRDYVDVDDES